MQVNVFGYANKVYPLCISKKSYDQTLNLSRLMFSITKPKDKKHYCMSCLQNFTAEEILSNHKCLLTNRCQAVHYESEIIKFTNHNKQIPILFKIYPDTMFFKTYQFLQR